MVHSYNAYINADQTLKTLDGQESHFKVKEFQCHDGSGALLIADELVDLLEKIRTHFGKPVTVNSGYRNQTYNRKQGSSDGSQHCQGTAADITIKGVSPAAIAAYAETLIPNSGGIGLYAYTSGGFTHVDVRVKRARWKHEYNGGPEIPVSKF
jgi:hypothetical protein